MGDFTARPTVYNGIKMRSRLEAGFAMWLDERHLEWKYEPQCFASPLGQYLPDFLLPDIDVLGHDSLTVYVECKPTQPNPMVRSSLEKAAEILAVNDEYSFLVVTWPGGCMWIPGENEAYRLRWVSARDPWRTALAISTHGPWPDGYWKPKVAVNANEAF